MAVDWDGADANKNSSLIAMRLAGKSSGQIAKELGVSRNAVIGRMNRLQQAGTLPRVTRFHSVRPASKRKPDWTALSRDERKSLIAAWQEEGLPVRACLRRVENATDNAIRAAASSFGMTFPDGRVGRGKKAAPVYRLDDIDAARERETQVEAEAEKLLEEAVSAVEITAPTCEPVHFNELADCHCRFMAGPMMYCGAPTKGVHVEPYCPFHAAITYQRNPEQRKSA